MSQRELIEELDCRQNEVLDKLNELNNQIEKLLNECLVQRDRQLAADAAGLAGGVTS